MSKEYKVIEIAESLNVSKATVQRTINKLGIEYSKIERNKYRYYKEEDIKKIGISLFGEDFDFESVRFDSLQRDSMRSDSSPQPSQSSTVAQENDNNYSRLLDMLQAEIEKKDQEIERQNKKIDALQTDLKDAYRQITELGKNAQYITGINETNKYIESKESKKSLFNKLFKKNV